MKIILDNEYYIKEDGDTTVTLVKTRKKTDVNVGYYNKVSKAVAAYIILKVHTQDRTFTLKEYLKELTQTEYNVKKQFREEINLYK